MAERYFSLLTNWREFMREQIFEEPSILTLHQTYIELQYFRDMLNTISNKVDAAINEGKTLDQVVADKPCIDFDEEFGQGLIPADVLVTAIYKSLKPE